jgi:hypothetical protein
VRGKYFFFLAANESTGIGRGQGKESRASSGVLQDPSWAAFGLWKHPSTPLEANKASSSLALLAFSFVPSLFELKFVQSGTYSIVLPPMIG